MSPAFALARRDLRGGLRSFRIFLACLALGVAAIAAVGLVRVAITTGLEREAAVLMGGDAEAEFTYRYADAAEYGWLDRVSTRISAVVSFRSLAVVGAEGAETRVLTEVQAVDDLYPLTGAVQLTPDIALSQAFAGAGGLPGAVMEQALADRLGIAAGDRFRLGLQDFVLTAILDRWPDNSAGGFGLGPRSMVRTADLANSGLLAEGTLFSTKYRLDLPEGANLRALQRQAEQRFRDTGMRWRDAGRGAGGTERVVERLGSFLILTGLSGLAVGGVGVSAAVRAWVAGRTATIATLRTLGATRRTILLTFGLQVAAMSVLGILLGLILGAALPLLAAPVLTARLPLPAAFGLYPGPLAEAALYGALTAALFTLWPLARVERIRPAALFRDALAAGRALPRWPWVIATGLVLALLIGSATLFTGSAQLTLWTAGGITGALAALALAAFLLRLLSRAARPLARGRPALRLALAALGNRGGETGATVLSLGLGLAVLAAVGQIDGNLRRAITGDLPLKAPSYFFVDIQPDQIDGFIARVKSDPGVHRVEAAPMLRGIITRINGRPAEEVAGEHWVIRGDRGVTYSDSPPAGTTVTAGAWWPEDYTGPPQMSFSAQEAAEMGLRLGDEVTVNILGREITATVTSFRRVEFETAGIGFVMSIDPAALAGAPHSWIATVYAEEAAEAPILNDLARTWPNITAIGIREAVNRAAELVRSVAVAIRVGALVTLATGALVLVGAAAAAQGARRQEQAVARVLGATRGRMLWSFALRAALTGAAAGLVALAAGIAGGWAVTYFVMDTPFRTVWPSALSIVLGGAALSLVTGLALALAPLSARPAQVLRSRE